MCFSPLNETEGVLLLHVQPNAKKTSVAGTFNGALKIRLNAPPVEGKANLALIGFLSQHFHLPRNAFRLVSGETTRQKRIHIQTDNAATFQKFLEQLEELTIES